MCGIPAPARRVYIDEPVTVTGCVFRLLLNPGLVNINQGDHYSDDSQVSLLLRGY